MYGKLLGELRSIEVPTKRTNWRIVTERAYAEGKPERDRRKAAILEALGHIAYVARLLDPKWDAEQVKPIRPHSTHAPKPPSGWRGAAFEVLRRADEPLTIREIVDQIGDRYHIDLSTVAERQRIHTAVTNGLKRASGELTVTPDQPNRYSLKMR